jgi:hypothetical protein
MLKLTIIVLIILINILPLHSGDSLNNVSSNTNIISNYLSHLTLVNLDLSANDFKNLTKIRYSNSGLLSSTTIPEELLTNSLFGYKLTDYFALNSYNDLKYNGDLKIKDISLIENKNLAGISFYNPNYSAKFYFGKEYQKLFGFDSFSNAGRIELRTNLKYSGYFSRAKYNVEKVRRTFKRNYSQQEAEFSTQKIFSPKDNLRFDLNYENLDNDRITGKDSENNPIVQQKKQRLYRMRTNLSYNLSNYINSRFNLSYNTGKYSRRVPDLVDGTDETQFQYTSSIEDDLRIASYWDLDLKHLSSKFKIEVNSKSFVNSITSDDPSQKNILQKNARQRDKEIFEILIANKFEYEISTTDSLGFGISYKSTKEDTPSEDENSDSDRLIAGADIYYTKHYNPWFSNVFRLSSRLQHVVWLKKEYSSGNNILQTLALDAEFDYHYEKIRMRPNIGISVEYISKDFPSLAQKYPGNVIRRFFVSDSVEIFVEEKFPIRFEYFYHYRESGDFDKRSFTQTINNKKEELILRSLLYYRNVNDDLFGIGMRYFSLNDSMGSSDINSFGPESEIILNVFGNWRLVMRTWLEFRLEEGSEQYTTIPNLNLTTEIGL